MKKIVFLSMIALMATNISAQIDTVFYFNDSKIEVKKEGEKLTINASNSLLDSAEQLLFEGVYEEGFSSEVMTSFSLKKLIWPDNKSNKPKKRKLYPHDGGLNLGFSSLSSRDLNIGNVEDAILQTSSYEWGFHLGSVSIPLSNKWGWLFFSGIGFRFNQYNADLNTAFRIVDNYTYQVDAPEGVFYKTSKLSNWYLTIPAMFEYQKRLSQRRSSKRSFYVQAGFEIGVRLSTVSKVKYIDHENNKIKEKIGRSMNVNPIMVDAKVGIGIGSLGLYVRYGLINFFRAERGADVVPVSAGIVWNW